MFQKEFDIQILNEFWKEDSYGVQNIEITACPYLYVSNSTSLKYL